MAVEYIYLADSYILIANLLFLVSYWQKQLLLLRLTLISATTFVIIMGLRYPTIYLDTIIFNVAFIFINVYLSIKIIAKLIPPKFTPEERKLYNKYFSRHFKPNEYRKLIDMARRKVYKVNTNIIAQGNGFYSLIFIVDIIGDTVKLELKVNGSVVSKLDVHSWIGIVEYIEIINKQRITEAIEKDECGKWDCAIDVQLHEIEEDSMECSEDDNEDEEVKIELNIPKTNNDQIVIYEWELDNLDKLYNDPEDGHSIKNGLHSIWLLYFSEYIYKETKPSKSKLKNNGSAILSDSVISNIKMN